MNEIQHSPRGNLAFMTIITIAAILSVVGIAVLGLNNVSLAILIVLSIGSVFLGKAVENWFDAKEDADHQKKS